MLNNQVPKSKPQGSLRPSTQGKTADANSNSTTSAELQQGKSRHDKGMELYKSGRVSIGANGLFKVSGYYECDTEKMSCTCPDYKTRKEPCKHLFAAMLFVKNRGKQKIGDLEGNGKTLSENIHEAKPAEAPNSKNEPRSKEFDRQSVITRLATINSAIEALKTHRKPIEYNDIVSLAAKLEEWALGN